MIKEGQPPPTANSQQLSAKSHLPTVDALRGFAALSVCVFHYTNGTLPRIQFPGLLDTFVWGYYGVMVFFVLSGFIIPYSLARRSYSARSFGSFFGKRLLRLAPPSYVILLFTLGQLYAADRWLHSPNHYTATLSWARVLHNFTYTIPFTGYKWLNNIYWTLAVEFQFYLLIGLLFRPLTRNKYTFLVGGVLLNLGYYLPWLQPVGFFRESSVFLLGLAVFMYYEEKLGSRELALALVVLTGLNYVQHDGQTVVFGLGTALALLLLTIRHPAALWLGRISYSLYLTHILVGTTLEVVLVRLLGGTPLGHPLVLLAICLGSALGVAYLFYRLVERPFVKLANCVFRPRGT
ncbi:acyltransferase [Hymenobacter sp. BT175]|uniref:acyltransferase family protein n=1 Tax=Hymenobacter translucens TaxID=2886507 RepID=UPI001D0E9E94|nr:acyltransferase [Hymenobacter translucens]MCC2545023.1 acyltransferase [Hymenobacter translucens]